MRVYICSFLILITSCAQAQKDNLVTIVDKNTSAKIPYPSVTLINKNLAYTGDVNGSIIFQRLDQSDTLLITKLGFFPLKLPVNLIDPSAIIKLTAQPPAKPLNYKRDRNKPQNLLLNKYDAGKIFYFTGLIKHKERPDYLQIAQKLTVQEPGAILKKININRLVIRPQNFPDDKILTRALFHVRIYDLDTVTGGPGNDLCMETIEVNDIHKEDINIEVSKYKILIPGKAFFIAVEWLRIPYNAQKSNFSSANFNTYGGIVFQPFIGISNIKGQQLNTWALNFRNQWAPYHHFSPDFTDFAISAVVSY